MHGSGTFHTANGKRPGGGLEVINHIQLMCSLVPGLFLHANCKRRKAGHFVLIGCEKRLYKWLVLYKYVAAHSMLQ